jgi:nucleoid-associated protein
MTAVIHHFVVHQIVLDQEGKLGLAPRNDCYDVTPDIEGLAQQLNQVFNGKPGKGVGCFVQDKSVAFTDGLSTMLENPDTFYAFSVDVATLLIKTLAEHGKSETGFLIFNHYQYLATDYLMITLLNTKQHIEINQALELYHRDHLDVAKMQLAFRVDLTQYTVQPEQKRYVSFIKGLMGRRVADFFMDFVGCEEQVDIKQQNRQLVQSVEEYLASEQLDPEEKHQSRQLVSDYYKEKVDNHEQVDVEELSGQLPASEQNSFEQFVQQSETPLERNFQADKTAVKSLTKFSGAGGGISISFDREKLGNSIHYDAQTDTLSIAGIPPNLKDQLLRDK